MGRKATVFWHAALSVAAGVLYFFFVLPRWPELMGETSHALGTAARIVAGLLIGLAGLPVVVSLVQLRKPEFGTPALALSLRTWSVVAHVTAGVLIVGTAIAEIWLSLDNVGQWLFGIYGAAAAIALIGVAALQLSFVAEQPPPAPKPLKPKKEKRQRRGRGGKNDDEVATTASGDEDAAETHSDETAETQEVPATDETTAEQDSDRDAETAVADVETEAEAAEEADEVTATADTESESDSGGLRNRRPIGKGTYRRRRSRRGVAVDE